MFYPIVALKVVYAPTIGKYPAVCQQAKREVLGGSPSQRARLRRLDLE